MKPEFTKQFSEMAEKISYKYWIVFAAIASILFGILLFIYLEQKPETPVPAYNGEKATVIVAATDIAPRTLIQSNMLTTKEIPVEFVPDDAITDVKDIVGKPAKFQIMRDDIVTDRKVLMDIKMAGFTGTIPPDCRAISIGINDVTGISGFAKPGDYVDVLVVSGSGNDSRITSNIILQNILLLAINKTPMYSQRNVVVNTPANEDGDKNNNSNNNSNVQGNSQPAPSNTASSGVATATLAVSPRDAMELIAAAQSGTVYLVLRPYKPRDTFTTNTEYSKVTNKGATPQGGQPMPAGGSQPVSNGAAAPAPAQSYGSVEVIRGTKVTREGA
ncbi:MAG: Flp pilus assembly protein CpaB [Anaerovibrio sp.]|uniref:Flp pilus assembly protein CpaB n=1 Tax=Anaerovibrio TaxID=82373 RepID=UPI001B1E792E|nr:MULTISPECIES: Flp pilus assembly protein CpaB [Anaerovibrio]MBO5588818.1 Flp pilus assembly protein CpaB [Anaerovibrio sp.]MBO6247028.1 Flp pilus assembly protein CpaB [Anaerovibrio sp.]